MPKCTYPGCQKNIREGQNLCIYHMDKDTLHPKLLDDINNDINGLIRQIDIKEDYNFEGFKFPPRNRLFDSKDIDKSVNLKNTIFYGRKEVTEENQNKIVFSGIIFNKEVSFEGAKFYCDVEFHGTVFNDCVSFKDAEFFGKVTFEDARFHEHTSEKDLYVNFCKTKFHQEVKFKKIQFYKNVYFNEAEFNDKLTFEGTNFHDDNTGKKYDVQFENVKFKNKVYFNKIHFKNNTSFKKSEFEEDITRFDDIHFWCKKVSFEDAKFCSKELSIIKIGTLDKNETEIIFDNAEFFAEKIEFKEWLLNAVKLLSFDSCQFYCNRIEFILKYEAKEGNLNFSNVFIKGNYFLLHDSKICCRVVDFSHSQFICESVSFTNTDFSDSNVRFFNVVFGKNFLKHENKKNQKGISFNDLTFTNVIFEKSYFYGDNITFFKNRYLNKACIFSNLEIGEKNHYSISFSFFDSNFGNVSVDFINIRIYSEIVDFSESKFSNPFPITFNQFNVGTPEKQSEHVNFLKVQFDTIINFQNCNICSKEIDFSDSVFLKKTIFEKNIFLGNNLIYDKTRFSENVSFIDNIFKSPLNTELLEVHFEKNIEFIKNELQSDLTFKNIYLNPSSTFIFNSPILKPSIDEKSPVIYFDNISFNPIRTIFENIHIEINEKEKVIEKLENNVSNSFNKKNLPYFIFRHCNLNDVYFSKCSMEIFSFYKNYHDLARFISCDWGKKDKRTNIIPEEHFLILVNDNKENKKNNNIEKFHIEGLDNYNEVATLYRRMKTALDNTKDFQESGKFYYNEFEMKKKEFKQNKKFGKSIAYCLYKLLAGYGEKPTRAIIGFAVFTFIFSMLHLYNGFYFFENQKEWFSGNISNKIFQSIQFSITFIFPSFNHLKQFELFDEPYLFFLYLANSIILWIMITLFLIGLKRHFRRF